MIRNYLKIAFRSILRNKSYAAINIAGLAIGMAACLLLFVIVRFESGFDTFQSKYDRIYRVVTQDKFPDGITYNPGMPTPGPDALRMDFPEAKTAAVYTNYGSQITVPAEAGNNGSQPKKFIEDMGVFFMEPQFFDIFDSKWLAGSPAVLAGPDNIVLDRTTAVKYFGDWKGAMGRPLKMDNTLSLTVAGVIEDAPANSDFPLKVMVSFLTLRRHEKDYNYEASWNGTSSNHQVFMLLPEKASPARVNGELAGNFLKKHTEPKKSSSQQSFLLQPLKDLHFDTRFSGTLGDHMTSKATIWTLSLIGLLIITMASINFVNLATAQSITRSKEMGIRKVLGSRRAQLISQSMGETFLIVLTGAILALIFSRLAFPYLKHVASIPETIKLFTGPALLFMLLVSLLVTLLSGFYPALVLSGFQPILALKSRVQSATIGGISLRRALVVAQFTISQVLIVGTIVAVRQMHYVRNADLGFNKSAVFVMPCPGDSVSLQRIATFKQQLLERSDVQAVSLASDEPSSNNNWGTNFYFDNSKKDPGFHTFLKYGDADYFKTFGIRFLAGKGYQPGDTAREFVINETLMKKLGYQDPEKIIGKQLRLGGSPWHPIAGVVKDFKTNSMRDAVKPLVISASKAFATRTAVKLRTARLSATVDELKKLWETHFPDYVNSDYFLDENIAKFYQQEDQLELVYKIFAGLAIFISCLGLYGLVSFMAVQKTREVGIRKVLGASAGSIVYLFSREFTILISIAFLVAAPIGWYLMNNWLHNFADRISLNAGSFATALIGSILIAWLTVGYKAIRAALANPVTSLRAE